MSKPILPDRVASIAESFIGRKESPLGSNRGPDLQEFFDADHYDPNGSKPGDDGYAWCAAFVCRVVQKAMEGREWTFKRPTTPGAWAFEKWSLAQDESTWTFRNPGWGDIERGDIVIFRVSHIGIATGKPNMHEFFSTVEGNTNDKGGREGIAVMRKFRHVDEIRSRIRFRV